MTATSGTGRGWHWLAIALALAVFALALAGIGSSAASAGGETARASRTVTVDIVSFAYRPANLAISRGSKVVFANASGTAHTATRKGSFTTGRIKAGRSASVTFSQRGTFRYHCTIHPFMRGKVVVE